LTKAESDAVMPKLEEMFLDFEHEWEWVNLPVSGPD
jgi:hypothetical protein